MFMAAYISLGLISSGLYHATTRGLFDFNGFASFLGSFFAGMFVGTILFSGISDRYGRKSAFTFAMLWYSVATLAAAFQRTPEAIDLWRFLAGIGIGVQLITVDTYISELTPRVARGRYMAFSLFVILTSVPIVALLSFLLVPHTIASLEGWRWVMIIGSLGAVLMWFVRRGLPESPRWLEAHGDHEAAERNIGEMERRVEAELGRPLPPPEHEADETAAETGSWTEIWTPRYLPRTIMLSVFNFFQTIGVYGFGSWIPILLANQGITLTKSLEYTLVIALATPLGAVGAITVADKFERKWQLVACAIAIAVFGLLFAQARTPAPILVFGSLTALASNWLIGIFHSYQAELYPTRIRAQAVGFVFSWSRISSIFVGYWVAAILKSYGVGGVFIMISLAMGIIVIVVGALGPNTNRIRLEVLSR